MGGLTQLTSSNVVQNFTGLDPAYLRLTIQEVCPGNRRLRGLQSRQPPLLRIPQEGHLDHDAVQSQVSERGVHGNPLPLEVDGECLIRGHRALLESIVIVSYPLQISECIDVRTLTEVARSFRTTLAIGLVELDSAS